MLSGIYFALFDVEMHFILHCLTLPGIYFAGL